MARLLATCRLTIGSVMPTKLIEVALPLEDINRESAREKSIRNGHPSTLHMWWARRPLAACRAVLFAQLVDDPSAHPDKFPTDEAQKAERNRLHNIISRLVVWENIHDEKLLVEAHEEILKSTDGSPPPILDPFAGGGSIPLEAQRLGLAARASDLNPIPVLINKALIEIPLKWSGRSPIFPGVASGRLSWPGNTGLAEDVRRYGKWMRDEAEKRIGHLYPKATIDGVSCTVIAWLWARTVTCPNPACAGTMPLVRSFWLSTKKGTGRYVIPIPDGKRVLFQIGGPDGIPRDGTASRSGAVCLICGTPVPLSHIRDEGKAGRMGAQLMAIAAEGKRQRYYLAPNDLHVSAAEVPRPSDVPEEELAIDPRNLWTVGYGLTRFADLFTNRQLTALTSFTGLVKEAHSRAISDGAESSYADDIATYLAMIVSAVSDDMSSICSWRSSHGTGASRSTFARQALPMVWDFAEQNCFAHSAGDNGISSEAIGRVIENLPYPALAGAAVQADAATVNATGQLVATDPPYYDNISYANLSDYFYVWLRRSLTDIYPELLGTVVT